MSIGLTQDGLPIISCDGCSACCMHLTVPPFDSYDEDDIDFIRLPEHLQNELIEMHDRLFTEEGRAKIPHALGSPCAWLDVEARRCRNYEHRPQCCRQFEPGCGICLEDREGYQIG